jgi:hypothetical protein
MMQFLAAITLGAAAGWLIANVGGLSVNRAVAAFAALIGGWRPDPWPRGVQEEDRDRPWARGGPPTGLRDDDQPEPSPTLIRLRPTIRSR